MPRLPTDYSRIVIYVIKCKDPNITEEYIGSTTDFTKRKNNHKSNCNNENHRNYNFKIYEFIRANGGWSNWSMIQLEEYPCKNKREAEKREEEIRVECNANLNMRRAFRTKEEKAEYNKQYYEQNREEKAEHNKQYYEQHKEEKAEKHKQWGTKEFICSCGWIGTNNSRRYHIHKM